jgi:ketosteroid isomerase-like protein
LSRRLTLLKLLSRSVDARRMTNEQLNSDREAIFAELLAAFGRRDHEVIRAAMLPDVVLELEGSSPLAGTYRGLEEVGPFVVALRSVLDTGRSSVSFLHAGDQMIVRHQISVHGSSHAAEMVLLQRFTFDANSGKLARITVEPEDAGLFDYVVHTALGDTRAS